jgi:hypothetical protein
MSIKRGILISIALFVSGASLASAQDLSKYRNLALGANIDTIAKQLNATPGEIKTVYQSPAVIQELSWWSVESRAVGLPESVQDIRLSFCNRELYSIAVTYAVAATQGLTAEDMVEAISAQYGIATRATSNGNAAASVRYNTPDAKIALWEDSQYSVTLSHSPLSNSFQLVTVSKRLKSEADAAIAQAATQEREAAPQKEMARAKKEADDLEAMRQAHLKAFRF